MDMYSDNNNLEELSETVKEYIKVSNKFRSYSTLKSSQKLYMRNIKSRLFRKERAETKKMTSLIPDRMLPLSNLNILSLLSDSCSLSLEHIDTLFVSDNQFNLFYTSEGSIKQMSGQLAYFLFFKRNQNTQKTPFKYPLYIFKTETEIDLIYNERMAQMRIHSAQQCVLQRFVFPRGDRVFKVRVHWKKEAPMHAYLLSNKLRVPRKSCHNLPKVLPRVKKNESLLSYLQNANARALAQSIYINKVGSAFQTDEEVSNDLSPFILQNANKTEFPESEEGVPKRNSSTKSIPFILSDQSIKDKEKPYVIMDNYPALWSFKKLQKIDMDIQESVNTVVDFLNHKRVRPTEIVIDFVRDFNKKWYFFSIPQYSKNKPLLCRRSVVSFSEQFASKSDFSFSRCSMKKESFSMMPSDSLLRESPKNKSFQEKKTSTDSNLISIVSSPKKSVIMSPRIGSCVAEADYDDSFHNTVQKVYDDSIKKFDQLIVRVKRLHMKNNEICAKYGGERFVKRLVAEFYNRILDSEQLREIYDSVDQAKMCQVAKKYKRMLGFSSTLSFRKSFKDVCFSKLMGEDHYIEYFQILTQVMTDFGVNKIDQDVILDEINYITNTPSKG